MQKSATMRYCITCGRVLSHMEACGRGLAARQKQNEMLKLYGGTVIACNSVDTWCLDETTKPMRIRKVTEHVSDSKSMLIRNGDIIRGGVKCCEQHCCRDNLSAYHMLEQE